jgi:hypothetical protein
VCKCSSYERALCINVNEIIDGLFTSIQFSCVSNLADSAIDFQCTYIENPCNVN